MQTAHADAYDAHHNRMKVAFELVQNAEHWKGAVDAVVTAEQLTAVGVTIADVRESVTYFTGTVATVEQAPSWVALEPRYHVTAPGYWAGPCN